LIIVTINQFDQTIELVIYPSQLTA
jgi:hypothetical protein